MHRIRMAILSEGSNDPLLSNPGRVPENALQKFCLSIRSQRLPNRPVTERPSRDDDPDHRIRDLLVLFTHSGIQPFLSRMELKVHGQN